MVDILLYYAASVLAIIFVLVPHEFAHAAVAYANGDPTPKLNGRITLNPIKHFDPIGFVMCALVGFGWARPVPINSANFKHYKLGLFTTAIAGVVANYLIAFIVYPLYLLCATRLSDNLGAEFLTTLLRLIYSYNLSIAVFNLLPLYPLDGFRVLEALTKPWNKVRQFLGKYGFHNLIPGTVKMVFQRAGPGQQRCGRSKNLKRGSRLISVIDALIPPHLVQCVLFLFFCHQRIIYSRIQSKRIIQVKFRHIDTGIDFSVLRIHNQYRDVVRLFCFHDLQRFLLRVGLNVIIQADHKIIAGHRLHPLLFGVLDLDASGVRQDRKSVV